MLSSVSAFFPCYNDANTIGGLVRKLAAVLPEITSDFEIIVVDDGSSDDSLNVLEEVKIGVPALRIVRHAADREPAHHLVTAQVRSFRHGAILLRISVRTHYSALRSA